MDAGRDLDEQVAQKVMGLVRGEDFGEKPDHDWRHADAEYAYFVCRRCLEVTPDWSAMERTREQARIDFPGPCDDAPRAYSTDIAAAWEVVGRLDDESFDLYHRHEGWRASIGDRIAHEGDTPAHAICLAALAAVNRP